MNMLDQPSTNNLKYTEIELLFVSEIWNRNKVETINNLNIQTQLDKPRI